MEPIDIFEGGPRIDSGLVFRVLSIDRRAFEIKCLVNVSVRRHEVVHDDKVNLSTMRQLDSVEPIEPADESVRVGFDVLMVLFEDFAQKLVLAAMDGLDDEAVVAREVEEGAGLAGRAELGQDVFGGERDKIICWIKKKVFAELSKDPRSIVFELEVVSS